MAWALAVFWILTGAWAFLGPKSFYDRLATFPPYNVHFLHDIGAFSIGLGTVLLLASLRWSTLRTALVGVGTGSAVHFVSHVVDYDLKPSVGDLVTFALAAVIPLVAGFAAE